MIVPDRPALMAIINTTPDSFSDGGRYLRPMDAIEHGLACVEVGADLLDIGGESTRPGAVPVGLAEELDRVLPVIEGLAQRTDALISIDTRKPEVAAAALAAGARMLNDVGGGRDPQMLQVAVAAGAPICLMHMLGTPDSMQASPSYGDVVDEVCMYLRDRAGAALAAGLDRSNIIVDPGFGFGKTKEHNLQLLARLPEVVALGFRVLIGTSRKSFLGATLGGAPIQRRLEASLATAAVGVLHGASIIRAHDVRETRLVVDMVTAVRDAGR